MAMLALGRVMVYYNPHMTGQYNPLYNLNNQGPFFSWLKSRLAKTEKEC